MTQFEISVVMPCLNEAGSIVKCIAWAKEGIAATGLSGEIVVSDNGSTDGSPELASAAGARVVHEPRRGYGNAYRRGFDAATGRIIVMGDSDGTYDFRLLAQLVEPISRGYDYVLGSRFTGEIQPGAMPWLHRYVGNPVLTRLLNLFYGYDTSDAHSGMRAFTREAYQRMALSSEGMELASEIVIKAARTNLEVTEVPIVYHRRDGTSKLHTFRDGWRHLRFLLLQCPNYLFLLPGVLMCLVGLLGQSVLLWTNLTLAGHQVGLHTCALLAMMSLIGAQLLAFGVFAKIHAYLRGYEPSSAFHSWLVNDFTVERGLLGGLLVFGFGFALDAAIVIEWLAKDLGPLDRLRQALLALSLMGIGVQILFTAFFLSLTVQAAELRPSPIGEVGDRDIETAGATQ